MDIFTNMVRLPVTCEDLGWTIVAPDSTYIYTLSVVLLELVFMY